MRCIRVFVSVVLSICFFPFYDLYAEEITNVTEKTVLVSVNGEIINEMGYKELNEILGHYSRSMSPEKRT